MVFTAGAGLLRYVSCRESTGVSMMYDPALHRECGRQRGRQRSQSAGDNIIVTGWQPILVALVGCMIWQTASAQQGAQNEGRLQTDGQSDFSSERQPDDTDSKLPQFNGCQYVEGQGPEMVIIPPSQFTMGSDGKEADSDEQPLRDVSIEYTFSMSRCEVTVAEFSAFVENTGHTTDAEKNASGCFNSDEIDFVADTAWNDPPGFSQGSLHPVVCISHNDAVAYIAWLNHQVSLDTCKPSEDEETSGSQSFRRCYAYRLPTESEFEYVLRSRSVEDYPWGSSSQCDYANAADLSLQREATYENFSFATCDDLYPFTSPVGSYLPNRFGLLDLSGNVWEWTHDCWNADYRGSPPDGSTWITGECDQRVLRGGGWSSIPENLRSANRDWNDRDFGGSNVGFRVARTLRTLHPDS